MRADLIRRAHVIALRSRASEAFELLFLEDAEEFGLERSWDVADLVAKQSAPIGQLEATDCLRDGACEGSPLAVEQLALQEV
jgi:hypothetical protein